MFSLEGKCALVTGGVSGVGLAIAQRFRRAGARVVMADLRDPEGVAAAKDCLFITMDVSQPDAVRAGFSEAADLLGQKLDILVNNAGINGEDGIDITESDEDLTRRLLEINTQGVYHGLKYGPKFMNDGGAVVNTSSLGATLMFPGSGPYSASKAAVNSYTQMAAVELAERNIRVNAVAPAFIRTPMAAADMALFDRIGRTSTCAGRVAEPEEVAAVVHFLASDDASYVTGQVINVDGGMSLGFTPAQLDLIMQE